MPHLTPADRYTAYVALLAQPDEPGLRRGAHQTQRGASDRHPRVWLRLMAAYTAWVGLQYDERPRWR